MLHASFTKLSFIIFENQHSNPLALQPIEDLGLPTDRWSPFTCPHTEMKHHPASLGVIFD